MAGGNAGEPTSRREVRYVWTLDLRSTPEELWPLVADTNRFDRDAGTPSVEHDRDRDAELENARCVVRQSLFRVGLEYTQEPFEWTYPTAFSVARVYSSGPLASLGVHAQLEARPDGGTRCRYEVTATPRNLLGRLAVPVQIGRIYQRTFRSTFQRYDDLVQRGEAWRSTNDTPSLAPGGRERLERGARELDPSPAAPALARFLSEGDDLVVSRIRPYALADTWSMPRSEVLDLFLRATRLGLVAFRWDVLCPLCGVAKASVEHLDELPTDVHCATCNIDYRANLERSVELTFRVTPSIREVDADEYCIGAPMATPHVVARSLLAPGATVALCPELAPGRHRLRCHELPGSQALVVGDTGTTRLEVEVGEGGWSTDEPVVAGDATIVARNATGAEQLVIVDRTPWSDQAVSAAEVTARQEFRDLFASEALRPGEQISVGSLTIAFTDLSASTELYRRVGDAVAFAHVLDHFEALREAIVASGGSVVKTIGDAVMAVFDRPAPAVDALLAAQAAVAAISPGGEPLVLKAGVHHGPCIAVTLNERLDYFGTTVNLAARLEGEASDGEIVLSAEVAEDPEVAERLRSDVSTACRPTTVDLKGFDGEITIHRLRRVAG